MVCEHLFQGDNHKPIQPTSGVSIEWHRFWSNRNKSMPNLAESDRPNDRRNRRQETELGRTRGILSMQSGEQAEWNRERNYPRIGVKAAVAGDRPFSSTIRKRHTVRCYYGAEKLGALWHVSSDKFTIVNCRTLDLGGKPSTRDYSHNPELATCHDGPCTEQLRPRGKLDGFPFSPQLLSQPWNNLCLRQQHILVSCPDRSPIVREKS